MNMPCRQIKVGNRVVGDGKSVYVIAEIGINHNGSVDLAKDMIKAAAFAGCNAVKFQKRTIELVYRPDQLARDRVSPFGSKDGDLRRGLELSMDAHHSLKLLANNLGMDYILSCWDVQSVKDYAAMAPVAIKVASASLTSDALLAEINSINIPVLLSTGMTEEHELKHAIDQLNQKNLALFHCVSSYPTPLDEMNLARIGTLRSLYPNLPIGYSGHEQGIYPTLAAVSLGAVMVERHMTLSRKLWGSDQAASLEPNEMREMIDGIRIIEKTIGDGLMTVQKSELPVRDKLRYGK